MNKDKLHNYVRSQDPNNRISLRSIFGDRTTVASVKLAVNEATDWAGKAYQCCFCRAKFKTLEGLNSHLRSQARTYCCRRPPPTGKAHTLTQPRRRTVVHLPQRGLQPRIQDASVCDFAF
jgi:hypothetical protein